MESTVVGRFRVPSVARERAGDMSEGWIGDVRTARRGWVLAWRYQETHPIGARDASRACLLLERVATAAIPDCEGIEIGPCSVRPITEDHSVLRVACTVRNPGPVRGHLDAWHCGDGKRLFAFFAWDSDEARLAVTSDKFIQRMGCDRGTTPARPLPAVTADLPAGFHRTVDDPAFVVMVNDGTGEQVRLGKGQARARTGDLKSFELFYYPIMPRLQMSDVPCRVLEAGTLPHKAIQMATYVAPEATDPGTVGNSPKLMVTTAWYCDRTARVYGLLWLSPPMASAPLGDVRAAARVPHPAYMDAPRCVEACREGR